MPLSAAKIEDNTTKANVFYLLLSPSNSLSFGEELG
jgi:hypothetical protein